MTYVQDMKSLQSEVLVELGQATAIRAAPIKERQQFRFKHMASDDAKDSKLVY